MNASNSPVIEMVQCLETDVWVASIEVHLWAKALAVDALPPARPGTPGKGGIQLDQRIGVGDRNIITLTPKSVSNSPVLHV